MNLNNFETNIPPTILERGRNYFEDGCVVELEELENRKWEAEVEGNYDDYNVEVKLDNKKNIKKWKCNCPYDGDVCKHIVAVLLAISEEYKTVKPKQKSKKTAGEWIGIIENTPDVELRKFLLDYAKNSREFQDELILHLSKSQDQINVEKYQSIIANNFDSWAGRHGFIQYHDAYTAMQVVHNLLEKADEYLSKEKFHETFSIAAAVAPQCIKALQYMDDSNGACGDAINDAFYTINKVLNNCDNQLSDIIFEWLYKQVQNADYADYGCADELEPIFFSWCNSPQRITKAYQFIKNQLSKHKGSDGWTTRYNTAKYLKFKIELLIKEGKHTDAEKIIDDNITISDFREIRIRQAIENNDFQVAIDQLKKGIEDAEKGNYPGIIHQFKKQLLDININQNDQANIRELSKEMFFENRGSIDYYRAYKKTFESDEWNLEREKMIKMLIKNAHKQNWGYVFQSVLASVYIEEKMWDRLLGEVQKANTIGVTIGYSKYLKDLFPDELIPLYISSISKYAENTGRNVYAEIARYLKDMAKVKGAKEEAKKLMQELLEKYKNRPAMKDEFRKLNW